MPDTQGSSRFIAFVDECGDHSLDVIDRHFPLFLLATVIVERSRDVEEIVARMERERHPAGRPLRLPVCAPHSQARSAEPRLRHRGQPPIPLRHRHGLESLPMKKKTSASVARATRRPGIPSPLPTYVARVGTSTWLRPGSGVGRSFRACHRGHSKREWCVLSATCWRALKDPPTSHSGSWVAPPQMEALLIWPVKPAPSAPQPHRAPLDRCTWSHLGQPVTRAKLTERQHLQEPGGLPVIENGRRVSGRAERGEQYALTGGRHA